MKLLVINLIFTASNSIIYSVHRASTALRSFLFVVNVEGVGVSWLTKGCCFRMKQSYTQNMRALCL